MWRRVSHFQIITIVRTRDLKHKLDTAYMAEGRGTPEQQEQALKEHAQLRALARIRKRQFSQQRWALANPENPPPPPPSGGLKRGPKPNPFLEKSEHGLHTQLTKREKDGFEALRKRLAPHAIPSVFLRWLICEGLERYRRKDCPTTPFAVDLDALEPRQMRASRAREARRLAA